jgi:chemotaxis protein MotB
MAKRPPPKAEASGASDWLTTYCDLVTLLFTFFVLLFAISQVDVQKFNMLVSALSTRGSTPQAVMDIGTRHDLNDPTEVDVNDPRIPLPFGPEELEDPLQAIYEAITEYISSAGLAEQVLVELGDGYIIIRLTDNLLFGPNSARIKQEDYPLLHFLGRAMRSVEDYVGMIQINGHTAAIPDQPDYHVSDRDLSSNRANAVLKFFEDEVGVRGDKLMALAFGKYVPLPDADNNSEEGRSRNRRIEIIVTAENDIVATLENIYETMMPS